MWKRIRSNRDPRDTLFTELRKEFSRYFIAAARILRNRAEQRPKLSFGLMITAMSLSMIFSFTLFRQREKPGVIRLSKAVAPATEGFSRILETSAHIRETLGWKQVVDSLASKKRLSLKDSLLLDSALDRLREINTHH